MKKQLLTLAIIGSMSSLSSHAIYNLYKNDGLSFDINGEVNLYLESDKVALTGQSGLLQDLYQKASDEKLRIYPENGASWLDFRASQKLPNGFRATGTLGMGYATGNGGSYLNSANLSFDKKNLGAITFGRQYLHTGFVARTNTFNLLDVFGQQAVRLDYYGVPNLHASTYYLFPSSLDVRNPSDDGAKTKGHGISASYTIPFANKQSLRLATGYSSNKANPAYTDAFASATNATGASVEYRFGRFLTAVDYGRQNATLNGNLIAKSKGNYTGIKIGYELSPKFNLMAGYGTHTTKATHQVGITADDIEAVIVDGISREGLMTGVGLGLLYNEFKEQKGYIRGDYYLKDNMRLYGQIQKEKAQAKLGNANYLKLDDTSYRLGVSLSF